MRPQKITWRPTSPQNQTAKEAPQNTAQATYKFPILHHNAFTNLNMQEIQAITREEPTTTGHPATKETHNRYEQKMIKENKKFNKEGISIAKYQV